MTYGQPPLPDMPGGFNTQGPQERKRHRRRRRLSWFLVALTVGTLVIALVVK